MTNWFINIIGIAAVICVLIGGIIFIWNTQTIMDANIEEMQTGNISAGTATSVHESFQYIWLSPVLIGVGLILGLLLVFSEPSPAYTRGEHQ